MDPWSLVRAHPTAFGLLVLALAFVLVLLLSLNDDGSDK